MQLNSIAIATCYMYTCNNVCMIQLYCIDSSQLTSCQCYYPSHAYVMQLVHVVICICTCSCVHYNNQLYSYILLYYAHVCSYVHQHPLIWLQDNAYMHSYSVQSHTELCIYSCSLFFGDKMIYSYIYTLHIALQKEYEANQRVVRSLMAEVLNKTIFDT